MSLRKRSVVLSSVHAGGPLGVCEDNLMFCFGLPCKVMNFPSPEGCKSKLENHCQSIVEGTPDMVRRLY